MGIDKNSDHEVFHLTDEELKEWYESLDSVSRREGVDRAGQLLADLSTYANRKGLRVPFCASTPYINTIHANDQPTYPGNGELEWRIRSLTRWNAMAMVVRANRNHDGIGGHISTYGSSATLYDVAFNHFFRGKDKGRDDHDLIYFQGHAAPGIYARAFLEGHLSATDLENFRLELRDSKGLSSYPHPWLMPDFWEFPTVSMGLAPIMAIYQARFIRYLEDRGLKKPGTNKVWCFVGDGETDEPETLGAITMAAREKLDNLIFVINCNLQRLDGPVRGNGKIIQELEGHFRGSGWNAIKVIWGADWDPLLEKDKDALLVNRMTEIVDGQYQRYSVMSGKDTRQHFFGVHPELLEMTKHLSDEKIRRMRRGGHDPEKIYAAYKAAVENKGSPTVILAKTIKGYGMGEAGEGRNITHQQKKLNEDELRQFRNRYGIPISDDEVAKAPFYRPSDNSPEIKYLRQRRKELAGSLPKRAVECEKLKLSDPKLFDEFFEGTQGREVSTTMAFVRILNKLIDQKDIGKYFVPIVSDEARTFGMEAMFRKIGIYSRVGQLYEPVDKESLLYYKEAKNGQILEEGITEAGCLSSFIAAGTAYSSFGIPMVPVFIFYSMFGFQRVADLIWAAGDSRAKGFLIGGTSGRTTLAGEGLQHQDGQSHVMALANPNLVCFDPAYAYEVAVIVKDGLKRMYEKMEDVYYYITVLNENYAQPPIPENCEEGILKGLYQFKSAENPDSKIHLLGSGALLNEVIKAQEILKNNYEIDSHVWSATSYKELYLNAIQTERENMFHPEQPQKEAYVTQCLKGADVVVSTSDYIKVFGNSIARWIPGNYKVLGTDGYGRSETREKLRDFFEVDCRFIVLTTLYGLLEKGLIEPRLVKKAMKDLKINSDKKNPMEC